MEERGVHISLPLDVIQEGKGSSSKFTHISARRWWNRLSRLQKSVIFMSVLIILGCVSVLTLSWSTPSPQPTESEPQPRQSLLNDNNNNNNNNNYHVREEENKSQNQHQNIKLDNRKPQSVVTTVPQIQGLERDGDDQVPVRVVSNERRGDHEDLSLDPAVVVVHDPEADEQQHKNDHQTVIIRPRPSRNTSVNNPKEGKKLQFDGPKNLRQKAVVEAFLHAWNGYRNYAWGMDHLRPISKNGQDWFGLGLTLVDSLDTMYIMNLEKEFDEAKAWIKSSLTYQVPQNVNLFETTIRVLGGLLSAYHLSGDSIFLNKAQELGSILLVGFKSPTGIPYSDVNLRSKTAHGPAWNPDSTTSEVSTLQLEFRDLSRITGNPEFEETAMNVSRHIHKLGNKLAGLVPIHISPQTGKLRSTSPITLGARGDSYYEYLVKQWIQTGKTIDFLRDDYLISVEGMRNLLMQRTKISNLTFLGELENDGKKFKPKMDHLVCYLPGTLALGVTHGLPLWHLDLAKSLLYTCYQTYKRQPTGLAPEITYFHLENDAESDFFVKPNDAHNLLRPETVESLWYLWQLTGDERYQDWGWEIFQSFLKYTRVDNGFTSISSVLNPQNTRPRDMMESFFLGETLKYFYLLFSTEAIFDLDKWVFNTEAHPFPIRDH